MLISAVQSSDSVIHIWGFPVGSGGKESTCNAENLGLIPGLGRYPGKGDGYPLQYSWLENFMDRGACRATVHGVAKLGLWGWAKQSGTTRTCLTKGRERPLVQSHIWGFPGGLVVKSPPGNAGDAGLIPGSRRSPGEVKRTHSSILAWEIPWTEESGKLQSMGSQKS